MLKTSTLLSVSIFVSLFIGLSDYGYGCHKEDGGVLIPHGKFDPCPPPDPDPLPAGQCSFDFSVEFGDDVGAAGSPSFCVDANEDGETDKVCSDGMDAYVDGDGKLFAQGGDGFEFATNRTGNPRNNVRTLCFDFTDAPLPDPEVGVLPFVSACRSAEMRIWPNDPDRGPLCDMGINEIQSLGFDIRFEVPGAPDDSNKLTFGSQTFRGDLIGCGDEVRVTRVNGTTWDFTNIGAARACLHAAPGVLLLDEMDDLYMPFTMRITALP